MEKKFPATIYVAYENDDDCFVIDVAPEEFAQVGKKKKIAFYRLENVATVTTSVNIKFNKRRSAE